MQQLKHFDLFSGYGGFSLALKRVLTKQAYDNLGSQKGFRQRKLLHSEGISCEPNYENRLNGEDTGFHTIGFSEIDKYASAVLK